MKTLGTIFDWTLYILFVGVPAFGLICLVLAFISDLITGRNSFPNDEPPGDSNNY